jgi:hypothetical protein
MNPSRNGTATKKTDLGPVLDDLRAQGWEPGLEDEYYEDIAACGIRSKNLPLAFVATELAYDENPITLRGLMYRLVSHGFLPSTDHEHYKRLGRLMTVLREADLLDFDWIVDNVRMTDKPSSWSGLKDFAQEMRQTYRKDFWAHLQHYVHIIVEKDAIAGVIDPISYEYDVALSPIRGYCSLSFAHQIAETWNKIEKPISCAYMGDFDASGFDLERDIKEKLRRYCPKPFLWCRLGVLATDFATHDLIPLKPKKTDTRYRRFVAEHGHQCAELDALPPTEIRQRVKWFIERHIDKDKWAKLQEVEKLEQETIDRMAEGLGKTKRT